MRLFHIGSDPADVLTDVAVDVDVACPYYFF